MLSAYVEKAIPLKQGLKHFRNQALSRRAGVEKAIPLKQGLKQELTGSFGEGFDRGRKGNSIKTRIETP